MLAEYAPWQPVLAKVYTPDPAMIAGIGARAGNVTVLAIVGTWCIDTKRMLPPFFAVLDAAQLPESIVTIVGVDRTKKDAEGLTEKWGVTRVPTFIFFRRGEEIGRVVEKLAAGTTLEREMLRVLDAK
jgi:thiol-disulfide isomerase/thioredoxin